MMRSYAIALPLMLVSACIPSRNPGGSLPGPEVTKPAVDSAATGPVAPYKWISDVFAISIQARTEQADSSAIDSLRRHATLRFTPEQVNSSHIFLFEVPRDSADTVSVLTARSTRLTLDPTGKSSVMESSPDGCSVRLPEVSPLLVRQLVFPADPRYLVLGRPLIDSLQYVSCIQGVRVQSRVELSWTHSSNQPSATELHLMVHVKGELHADSTRRLPMNLSGRISGTSSLVFGRQTLRLKNFQSEVTSEFDASSGTERRQRFRQVVSYGATRDTTASVH